MPLPVFDGEKYISPIYYNNQYYKSITNEEGFRMKPFQEIDENNYILFLGCSNTFGVGIDKEDSYTTKISQYENSDSVNLGVVGGSNGLILNLFKDFMQTVDSIPKFVMVNWTGLYRKHYWEEDKYIGYAPWLLDKDFKKRKNYSDYINFITDEEMVLEEFLKSKHEVESLCNQLNIPLIQMTFFHLSENGIQREHDFYNLSVASVNHKNDITVFENKHTARDDNHPGIEENNTVFEWYQNNFTI